VTSGGVCLDEINSKTMESKLVSGLYFCGEVIDVDGFCGGFNLQNCWSTGFIAGTSCL
jgi:predicted flavoprotein YhiN